MTAVKWLLDEINKLTGLTINSDEPIVEQANKMFEQQIIDAYANGEDNVDNDGCTISKNGAESYFIETYGSKGSETKQ